MAFTEEFLSSATLMVPVIGTNIVWGINAVTGGGELYGPSMAVVGTPPTYAAISTGSWTDLGSSMSVIGLPVTRLADGDYAKMSIYSNGSAYAVGITDYTTATFSEVTLTGLPASVTPSAVYTIRASDLAVIFYATDGNFYAANSSTGACTATSSFPYVAYTGTTPTLIISIDGAWGAIYNTTAATWAWGGAPTAAQATLTQAISTLLAQANVSAGDSYTGVYSLSASGCVVYALTANNIYVESSTVTQIYSRTAFPTGSQGASGGYGMVEVLAAFAGTTTFIDFVGHSSTAGYCADVFYINAAPAGVAINGNETEAEAGSLKFWLNGIEFPALVIQTQTQALTQYTNFPFNSFAIFQGVTLAATDAGLFQLGGDEDNGVPIHAFARVGMTDFGTSRLKRVDRCYVGYRAMGEMLLRVIDDEINIHDYALHSTHRAGLHGNHARIGRNLYARYWQFELQNIAGADFTLNALELRPVLQKRRRGGADA